MSDVVFTSAPAKSASGNASLNPSRRPFANPTSASCPFTVSVTPVSSTSVTSAEVVRPIPNAEPNPVAIALMTVKAPPDTPLPFIQPP